MNAAARLDHVLHEMVQMLQSRRRDRRQATGQFFQIQTGLVEFDL